MVSILPETMKAWTHTRAGLPRNVLAVSTLPTPTIASPTQVLVRVSYCALNPAGSIVMQLLPFLFRGSPAIPEMDFSGTVVEAGPDVPKERNLRPGTHIFGSIPVAQHVRSTSGAMAKFVVVDHTAIVRMPDAASLMEVSGLGIAGATALELIKAAKLKKGDSVLVNGASGGIGHLVLQMCCEEVGPSGKVIALCSSSNVDWVKKLCAEESTLRDPQKSFPNEALRFQVIDYNLHAPIHEHLIKSFGEARFDSVIDAVGIQDIFNNSPTFLAEGKSYVTVGPRAHSYTYVGMLSTIGTMIKNAFLPRVFGGVSRSYIQVTAAASLAAMQDLAKMVAEGTLKVHVGFSVGMEDAQKVMKSR
jgi:NADPH:quinone reductase-like Zn-dependent oxidoreductase